MVIFRDENNYVNDIRDCVVTVVRLEYRYGRRALGMDGYGYKFYYPCTSLMSVRSSTCMCHHAATINRAIVYTVSTVDSMGMTACLKFARDCNSCSTPAIIFYQLY